MCCFCILRCGVAACWNRRFDFCGRGYCRIAVVGGLFGNCGFAICLNLFAGLLLCSNAFGGIRFGNHVGKWIVLHFGNIFATFEHGIEVFVRNVPATLRPKDGLAHRRGKVAHALFLGTRNGLTADGIDKSRLDFGIFAEEHCFVRHFVGVLGVVLLAVNPDWSEQFALAEHDVVRLDHFEHSHERHCCDNRVRIVVEQVFKERSSMNVQEVVDGLLTVLNGHVVQFNVVDRLGNLGL